MKRFASLILAVVMILTMIPVAAHAAEIDGEDMILDYGNFDNDAAAQGISLMAAGKTYKMKDIPAGETYREMTASQLMIDVIKDFEGFSAKAYWDNTQYTVGYGTRASGPNVVVTRAEAEQLLRKALKSDYERTVNDFCRKKGKQPTQQQFDALLDLTYNVGGSWTTGTSVPDVVLNPSTALDIVKGFGAWSRSGGKVSYVHANRRIREALIYLYGEYYLAYGGQDCKTGLKIVSNDDLPHFKTVIFKTNAGTLSNGKTDYAAYYPVGDYYRSFITGARDGYTLVGWKVTKISNKSVSDGKQLSVWNRVENNLELTAVWEKGNISVTPEKPPVDADGAVTPVKMPFQDVAMSDWFYGAVSYVYSNQFMDGTSDTTFDPNTAMTRGMLVTVLYRIDGSVSVSDADRKCFDDIAGQYYTDAVAWAHKNGIVDGVSDSKFEPNRIITRQEAITIFHRYCVGGNTDGVDRSGELDDFIDRNSIADFAVNSFAWAVSTGLVEGSETANGAVLNPTGSLNRAEAATLLQRCVEEIL